MDKSTETCQPTGWGNGPDPYQTLDYKYWYTATSSQIGWILKLLQTYKVFLDAARAHESVENSDAPGLIVCAARAGSAKWLLTYNCARALLIVVHITSGVAQPVGCLDQSLAF